MFLIRDQLLAKLGLICGKVNRKIVFLWLVLMLQLNKTTQNKNNNLNWEKSLDSKWGIIGHIAWGNVITFFKKASH